MEYQLIIINCIILTVRRIRAIGSFLILRKVSRESNNEKVFGVIFTYRQVI